mgnify:FL=1
MDTPKKLLVAVDGSEGAGKAASLAAGLAKRLDVPMELVFVFPTDMEALAGVPGGGVSRESRKYFVPGAFETLEKEATELVFTHAREAAGNNNLIMEETVLFGMAAHMLIDHANETSGALLVMSRRGRSHMTEMLLGSVSQRVIQKAHCPVLLVP